MTSLLRFSFLLIFAAALATSCKKPVPEATKHIPKNASVVATINTESLHSKLAKNQGSIENILKSMTGNDTSAANGKQEWEDLKTSGIELDENFYMSVVQKGGAMGGSAVVAFIGSLDDASKFEAYVKKKSPASEIRKEKDYSFATTDGDKMVAWGKEIIIALTSQQSGAPAMEYDSTTGSFNFKQPVNVEKDLKAEMDNYFNMKEDASVAAIPEFRDLMQDKSDASFWVNSSSAMENIPLPLPKLKELLGNSFTAATLNFGDGKITAESKSYYSNELRDLMNQYKTGGADLSLIESFPSDNVNGFAAFSFNPDFFNGLVKYLEVGGIVDGYLTKMMGSNYTLAELLKAVKGDVAVVVGDVAIPSADSTAGNMRPSPIPAGQVIVNIPVGDKVQMNRLMDKLVEMRLMTKVNNEYRLALSMQQQGWQAVTDDKNLILASSEALYSAYKAKSKKAGIAPGVMNDFKDKPGVFYVNIESILKGLATTNADAQSVLPKAKETFKDVRAYSAPFNGKYLEGHMELRFKNEKENSLTSLLSFLETASKNVKRSQNRFDDEPLKIDTIAIPARAE